MNILIAEDDTEIRHLVRAILEEEGHACVEAGDGIEAQAAMKCVEQIDLLLSDLRMPNMGGVELLKWCRDQGHNIPVIFMSANADLLQKEKLNVGESHAAILPKPVDIADILNAVITAKARAQRPSEAAKDISAQDLLAMRKNLH